MGTCLEDWNNDDLKRLTWIGKDLPGKFCLCPRSKCHLCLWDICSHIAIRMSRLDNPHIHGSLTALSSSILRNSLLKLEKLQSFEKKTQPSVLAITKSFVFPSIFLWNSSNSQESHSTLTSRRFFSIDLTHAGKGKASRTWIFRIYEICYYSNKVKINSCLVNDQKLLVNRRFDISSTHFLQIHRYRWNVAH